MGNKESGEALQLPRKEVSKATVKQFDLASYSGIWYVVAAIPSKEDAECAYSVYSTFPLSPEEMSISSSCIVGDRIVGHKMLRAKIGDKADPGKLTVVPREGGTATNYWVYETDYNNYSLVGDGSGDSFQVFFRRRTIPGASLGMLLAKVSVWGYDTNRVLIRGKTLQ